MSNTKLKMSIFPSSFIICIMDWIVMSVPVRPTPALSVQWNIKTDENWSLISAFPQRVSWAYIIDHLSEYYTN